MTVTVGRGFSERAGNFRGMIGKTLLAVALIAIMSPLAWVCVRMAHHAQGGAGLLAGIAGAVALGAGAFIIGLLFH